MLITLKRTPIKFCSWGSPPQLHIMHCMDFTIVQIGDETRNGNRIVKMQHKVEQKTALGTMTRSETYYAAVRKDAIDVMVDDVIDLNTDDFTVRENPFVHPETGEEMMLKYLVLKA